MLLHSLSFSGIFYLPSIFQHMQFLVAELGLNSPVWVNIASSLTLERGELRYDGWDVWVMDTFASPVCTRLLLVILWLPQLFQVWTFSFESGAWNKSKIYQQRVLAGGRRVATAGSFPGTKLGSVCLALKRVKTRFNLDFNSLGFTSWRSPQSWSLPQRGSKTDGWALYSASSLYLSLLYRLCGSLHSPREGKWSGFISTTTYTLIWTAIFSPS